MKKGFIKELRQRNVFKVALGYLIGAWLVAQVADLVLQSFDAPDWTMRALLIALAVGFPIALVISWAFEVTADGVVPESQVDRTVKFSQESGRRLDFSILLILAIVIIFMGLERFVFSEPKLGTERINPIEKSGSENHLQQTNDQLDPTLTENAALTPVSNKTPNKSVAVLPFTVMSTGPDDEYFADGLTEEIINALSQLPDLMVTARTSAFHFKGQNLPVGEIAGQLGVDHIVEGSVRRAGNQLRITAQLIRADDGFHLWSETYDRRTEDTFAVQDDISQKVAKALDIVLDDAKRNNMRLVGVRNVEAFVAFQKGVDLYNRAHIEPNQISLLRQANQHYDRAIELYPEFRDAYLQHSDLYSHILLTQASGVLDGEITAEDIDTAPRHLRSDFDNSIRFAKEQGQVLAVELDRALILGEWRGLKSRSERSLQFGGCETSVWAHLAASAFGNAALARDAFKRTTICDPLLPRPDVHLVQSMLWLGQWGDAINNAERQLANSRHPWLIRSLAMAQAMQGDFESAENTLRQQTVSEEDLLFTLAILSAIEGDARAAANYSQEFLDKFGPNDELALRLEASRGNHNEANRLAAQIDARPFGYIPLMQVIYYCACGAPFDLEATPVLAEMLEESGLPWPPASPIKYPLKDW